MAQAAAAGASVIASPFASVANAVLPSDGSFLGPVRGGAALIGGIFLGQALDSVTLKLSMDWKANFPSPLDPSRSMLKSTLLSLTEAMVSILVLEVAASKMNSLHTTVFAIAMIPQLNYAEQTAMALWGKAEKHL